MTEGKKRNIKDFLKKHPDFWAWILVLIIVLFTVFVRVRLLNIPLERDEAEYAYSARLLLKGIPLYTESIEFLKLPGLYAAYALILGIFGNSVFGLHLGLLVVNVATLILIYFLARRLFDASAGVMASASFAILSVGKNVLGFTTNAEPLLLLPAVGGFIMLLRAVESHKKRDFFLCGLLLGLAFIIKQPAIYFIMFAGLYILVSYKKSPSLWLEWLKETLIYSLGAVTPFVLSCILLYTAGVFEKFWFWTIKFAMVHGSRKTLSYGINAFKVMAPFISKKSIMIWCIAGVGFVSLLWDKKARSRSIFVIMLFIFSFLAVSMGYYFRPHYFILSIPVISLLAGLGIVSIARLFSKSSSPVLKTIIPVLLAIIVLSYSVYTQRAYLFKMKPNEISRSIYGSNPFIEAIDIAKYIEERTNPDDRIAVIGSEPEIYFYANRRSASKYIVLYTLTGVHEYALSMQKDMIKEIESNKPKYLVHVNISTSWSLNPDSEMLIFKWSRQYTIKYYDLVGLVDIFMYKPTEYYWDEDAVNYKRRSKYWIAIYKRKT